MTVAESWRGALAGLEVRHPNGRSKVDLTVLNGEPPELYVGLDETTCTMTGAVKRPFAISTVKLTYYPGTLQARLWLAAAWAGYCQHEALELVTLAGDRSAKVLDPHAEPYAINPVNRGLRDGFPVELTPTTLAKTLALVMSWDAAAELAHLSEAA